MFSAKQIYFWPKPFLLVLLQMTAFDSIYSMPVLQVKLLNSQVNNTLVSYMTYFIGNPIWFRSIIYFTSVKLE